jgi:hypothetical protein
MAAIIYLLSGTSILLAAGGFYAYKQTKQLSLLLSSIISTTFAVLAIVLIQWWPLVVGFVLNWGLRLIGLDPSSKK